MCKRLIVIIVDPETKNKNKTEKNEDIQNKKDEQIKINKNVHNDNVPDFICFLHTGDPNV